MNIFSWPFVVKNICLAFYRDKDKILALMQLFSLITKCSNKSEGTSLFLSYPSKNFIHFWSIFPFVRRNATLFSINQQTCHAQHKLKIHVKELEATKEWMSVSKYFSYRRTHVTKHYNDPKRADNLLWNSSSSSSHSHFIFPNVHFFVVHVFCWLEKKFLKRLKCFSCLTQFFFLFFRSSQYRCFLFPTAQLLSVDLYICILWPLAYFIFLPSIAISEDAVKCSRSFGNNWQTNVMKL